MIPIATDAWFELWVKEAPAFLSGPGASGSIEISLRRDDAVRVFTAYYVDGVIARMGGADPDADLRVEVPEDLWISISEGDVAPMEKAMLKGELRIAGKRERLVDLGGLSFSEGARALMARIHAQTEY